MAIGKKTGGRLLPKGYKLAKGGKRLGAGRLTREVAKAKKLAADIVRDYIEERLQPIVEAYVKYALEDPATLRHLIERFLPPARAEAEANERHNVTIITIDPNEERRKIRDRLLAEDD